MSITGVSQSLPTSTWSAAAQQRNDAFNALDKALGSGDLAGAQTALANVQKLAPQNGNADDPFQKDLASLSSALQSGDLSSAQSTFSTMKQAMSAHRGHHRPPGPPPSGGPPPTDGSTSSTAASATGGLDITA
ncbi:MAG TPA: hypothetical protein VG939_04510 [Caulobacteraceae bacterium]|nr:hypothetical protein [Caulobacteraceae bacterium]